jgi:hypothetical protein
MEKKYKYAIIFSIVFLILIGILFFVYFKFFYKVSFYRYSDDEFKFNYDVNFRVSKEKGIYKIVDKDNRATITIEVLENDEEAMSIDKDRASSLAQERIVDSSYNKISFSCLDHICQSVYQNDKKEITIDVEYIDKFIYIYKMSINIEDSEKYMEKFDLVVNSFIKVDE